MERLALTVLVLAVFALAVYGMWRGWRRKAREQSARYDPFPEVPARLADPGGAPGIGPRDELSGIYVATTRAGHWQDRIVTRGAGMRGPATLRRYSAGVVVDRQGAPSFFIPAESIVDARTAKGMAGKVMGTDGLLVLTWRLGESEVDTGFRGDDVSVYPRWIHALLAMSTVEDPPAHPEFENDGGSR